jgi:hypothetical protein
VNVSFTVRHGAINAIKLCSVDSFDREDAKQRYRHALSYDDQERVPFYAALVEEFEHDELALSLLASVSEEQRNPMLILAALHLAALRGHSSLSPIYDAARSGRLTNVHGAACVVLSALHENPRLVRDELWRSTQTNEPGRSAIIQAVVRDLAPGTTINIVDVGASAGINLYFDQFRVATNDGTDPLTLVCEDLNTIDRSTTLARVVTRVGIDPHPLDLQDFDDRLWLKACIWPEEPRRHERFDAIVAARTAWPPSRIIRGTVGERLEEALALCANDALTLVVNTWVAFYLSESERSQYFAQLHEHVGTSNVAWLSVEAQSVKWPNFYYDATPSRSGGSLVVVTRPGSVPSLWGWSHPHRRWLEKAPSTT